MSSKTYTFSFVWEQKDITFGNVGVGTATPSATLDIVGDVKFSGDIYFNYNKAGNWIKNNDDTVFYSDGSIGINTTTPSYPVDVNGIVRMTTQEISSDRRLKYDIVDETLGIEFVQMLKPKFFNYKNDNQKSVIHGFIAQDIDVNSFIVEQDAAGYLALEPMGLIAPLIKSLQELIAYNTKLQNDLNSLEQELGTLQVA